MRAILLVLVLVASVACSQKKSTQGTSDIFLEGKRLAEVTDKRLEEASGLAASANNPGLLWTLNDSGNKAEIFLIDEKTEIRLTCVLKNILNRDWEDVAVGPGPENGKNYLYVADIGDNLAMFPYKRVYRFEEPVVSGNTQITIENFDTITFRLPGEEIKDTESLMINPVDRNLYVVSKREEPVYVYELKYPYATQDTLTATKLISLPFTQIVAADFSADGKSLLMKNYRQVFYWEIGSRELSEALKDRPQFINYKEEPQGEAITFSRDGSGFYTISEMVKGTKSYLYYYPRK
jgi:hypothetical protein